MAKLNLGRKGIVNTIELYKRLGQEDTLECKTLKDWLSLYDENEKMREQIRLMNIMLDMTKGMAISGFEGQHHSCLRCHAEYKPPYEHKEGCEFGEMSKKYDDCVDKIRALIGGQDGKDK